MTDLISLGKRARAAQPLLACASTKQKNLALSAIAEALEAQTGAILQANEKDVQLATERGMSPSLLDRLKLSPQRIVSIAQAVREVIDLPDPVGVVLGGSVRPNGLRIQKISVPFGVVGMIYEARPNVTADAAALSLKSGNVCLLRGGKEAFQSNLAMANIMRDAVGSAGLPKDCILFLEDTSRETATAMMKLNQYLDLLIPRGGAGLIRSVVENATVPVIETGTGNCHIYVDASADLEMAVNITDNAKTSRPSVCNAAETLLVHRDIAREFLPLVWEKLQGHQVELRGCPVTCEILGDSVKPATQEDYATEFLDYILAVKVVDSLEEAIAHIARYSTKHSECIVTQSYPASQRFLQAVDAAVVYVNASTRFTDGGEFGLGAEIGISTQKLHARGPMGLSELTSYKYLVQGDGQIR